MTGFWVFSRRAAIVSCVLGTQISTLAIAQSSTTAESDTGAIQDIIVTAQRREQRLQDVPISVSAISSSRLSAAGAEGTSTLQVTVPSLVVQRQLNGALPFLRGVGFSVGDVNAENSVAVYLDGVYQPTPHANFFDFAADVERVEVLKGPQGTLFGRNSTGGVIQVITKRPSETPTVDFSMEYANYDRITASAYAASGLAPDVAASVSVLYDNQGEGWGRNLTTGREIFKGRSFSSRGKLLFTPGERTEIVLSADYTENSNTGLNGQSPEGASTVAGEPYPGRYNAWSNDVDYSRTKSGGGSLTIDHELEGVSLKSISAYRRFRGSLVIDQDLSSLPLIVARFEQKTRMYTQEFHVESASGSEFQWLVGAYFFDYKASQDPLEIAGLVFGPLGGILQYGTTHSKSYSLFAQGTYPLGPETNLTIGGRYTWDRSTFTGSELALAVPVVLDPEQSFKLSYDKPTWRVSLDHKLTPDVMAYASYNRGVKSGNYSVSTAPSLQAPYLPEQNDAFEVGLKTELFDRHVILNAAAFHYSLKNVQFQRISGGVVTVFNGPSAKIYGGEIELTARVTPELTLNGNLGVLHSRIGDFPSAPNSVRTPAGTTVAGPVDYNAEGNRMPNSPSVSGNVGFMYQMPVSGGKIELSGNAYYSGKYYSEIDNRLFNDDYWILNASIGWRSDKGLRLSVWGKNLSNSYNYAQLAGQADLSDLGSPSAPRTYGITLGYGFN